MRIFSFFIFVFLSLSIFVVSATVEHTIIDLDPNNISACVTAIKGVVMEPFIIKKITYQADYPLSRREVLDLIGIHEGENIDVHKLERTCHYLNYHKRLKHLQLHIFDDVLHVMLSGHFVIRTIKLIGPYFGKEKFRVLYGFFKGDIFDQKLHQKEIESMIAQLHAQGYQNAHITDTITQDKQHKTVDIILKLELGVLCEVERVKSEFFFDGKLKEGGDTKSLDQKYSELKKAVRSFTRNHIKHMVYSQKNLDEKKRDLTDLLLKFGYTPLRITFDPSYSSQDRAFVRLKLIIELRDFKKISFSGNNYFTHDELINRVLHNYDIEGIPLAVIEKEISQAYKKKGFWSVSVSVVDKDGWRVCKIKEGPRAFIKKFQFRGVSHENLIPVQKLLKVLINQFYDQELEHKAVDTIILWYIRAGYWDAQIIKTKYKPLETAGHFLVIFTIDEGVRRFLATAKVEDYPYLSLPFASFQKRQKQPFDLSILREQKKWIEDYFASQGYAQITVAHELSQENSDVHVTWKVTLPKEPARFGKTVINRVGKLPYEYVTRQLCFREGDVWDQKKLERSLKRLRELDLFETVSCKPLPEDTLVRPYLLTLIEKDPIEISGRVGFETMSGAGLYLHEGSTYKLGGSLVWRNPANYADHFRFDADISRFQRTILGEYRVPFLANAPLVFTLRGYSNKYRQPLLGSIFRHNQEYVWNHDDYLYVQTDQGGGVQCSYTLARGVAGLRLGGHVAKFNETSISQNCLSHVFELDQILVNQHHAYILFEPYYAFEFLDDILNPRSGVSVRGSCKILGSFEKNVPLV